MSLYRRSPRGLEAALAPLRKDVAPQTLLAEAQTAWPGVVGELIAGEAHPFATHGGTVEIACSAAVWAQELELLSEDILARLNQSLTRGRLTRLRCRVDGR
ncbi:MAG: DUF721 domain-containing protein [Solirubrobacterales bacterium]|nr:DUF721 domain-containing protein [Solirubrobacterales bacterium]